MATIGRSTSITLTAIIAINVMSPQADAGFWPWSSNGPTISVKQNGKNRVFKLKQGSNPSILFIEDAVSGHLLIRREGSQDIDTGFGKVISMGLPSGLSLKNDNSDISTYEVKSEGSSQLMVVNTTDGVVLINRVKRQIYDRDAFYDHVMTLGKIPKIVSQKTQVQEQKSEYDGVAPGAVITILTLENGSTRKISYGSNFQTVLMEVPIPSAQKALESLRTAKEDSIALQAKLKGKIFGQDLALERLAHHLLESKTTAMTKPKVLEAVGPSGVGKSYTAQVLADEIYDNDKKFVLEIAGSEYSSGSNSLDYGKLLGTSKSVKDAQEGELITWLKANGGRGLLIINEMDKMHSDIAKKLMEFFEKGRLTDWEGKEVWGRNVVIWMTSNRGATRMFPASVANWSQEQIDKRLKGLTQTELRDFHMQKEGPNDMPLPREIMNRIDEFIPFGPFTKEAALLVARASAKSVVDDFHIRYGLEMHVDPTLIDYVALTNFTSADDARQINNQIKGILSKVASQGATDLHLESGDRVSVTLSETATREKIVVVSANGNNDKTMILAAPKEIKTNVLQDQAKVDQLRSLKENLKKEVIGQDVAMDELAEAVKSYDLKPNKDRPFSALLVGPSGNGKTETARALSKALGLPFALISMGQVQSSSDMDNIFGYSAKYNGGDDEAIFDRIIRENPNGAVIVLDEFSNMGGGDPNLKNALAKRFYEMFEEGTYTSPRDHRTYDLKKFKFILTGNDGEEMFAGVTADDVLLTTWKENRDPEKVRDMLRRAGFPNALLNRMWKVLLMKPLLSYEVGPVTEKLWKRETTDYEKANPGVMIYSADGFKERLARSFFTGDQGGRALRKVLDNNMGSVIGGSLLASGVDVTQMKNVKVLVDLEDNFITKPYLATSAPERRVVFVAHVYQDGNYIHTEKVDVTTSAVQQVLMNSKTARAVAYHEAGHAIANDPELTLEKTVFVTIRGGRTRELAYYGYARTEPVGRGATGNYDHDRTIATMARLWAGRKAQEMAGFPADAGWSNDYEKMQKIGTLYLTKWGLDRELIGTPVDKDGNAQVTGHKKELLDQRLGELISEGERLASQLLNKRWRAVRAMTAELLMNGEIKEERIDQIRSTLMDGKAQGVKNFDWTFSRYQARTNKCGGVFFK